MSGTLKYKIATTALCFLFAFAALAAQKHKAERQYTYDKQTTVFAKATRYDSTVTSTVGGNTYTSACNSDSGFTTCTDHPIGYLAMVHVGENVYYALVHTDSTHDGIVDPLRTMLDAQSLRSQLNHEEVTFSYRNYVPPSGEHLICVPFTWTEKNRKKTKHNEETCYELKDMEGVTLR
jgi:hypothetical protein